MFIKDSNGNSFVELGVGNSYSSPDAWFNAEPPLIFPDSFRRMP